MTAHHLYVAIMGISIVFASLCFLAVAIHVLPRALTAWDNKGKLFEKSPPKPEAPVIPVEKVVLPLPLPPTDQDMARQFYLLAKRLSPPFALPRLLYLADKHGIRNPHAGLARLITARYILPDQNGYFLWNKEAQF